MRKTDFKKEYMYDIYGNRVSLEQITPIGEEEFKRREAQHNKTARIPRGDKYVGGPAKGISRYPMLRNIPTPPKESRLTRMPLPTDTDVLRYLGEELLAWSLLDEALNIDDFPLKYGISPYRFYHFRDELFQEYLDVAKSRIASRLQKLARENKLNMGYLHLALPKHDQIHREYLTEKRDKESVTGERTPITVIVDPIPHIPLTEGKKDGN
jgi:hypothetical protein